MASNVVVLYGARRSTIKVTPTRTLSEVHAEACTKFGVNPQSFALRRNRVILDLTLQIRFANLLPGAKLDLVQARNQRSSVTVVLRVQEDGIPNQDFSGTFQADDTLWGIIRKVERQNGVNLTERGSPSGGSDSGRILYDMLVARVGNKEITGLHDLQQSLGDLGIRAGRQLIVLRFKNTETPFEDALQEISMLPPEEVPITEPEVASAGEPSESAVDQKQEDLVMQDAFAAPAEPEDGGAEAPAEEGLAGIDSQPSPRKVADPDKPAVAVFRPSDSNTLAASRINVPDKAYDIGIAEAKQIQANIKKETIGKRLPSDKEIEEQQAAALVASEKVDKVAIKVRFPDGYISEQIFYKKHTAQDLYDAVRGTLRYPAEPFSLIIPPREALPQAPKKLTTDLKLRTGATVHLVWGKGVSERAKKEPALMDEFLESSQPLPLPKEPEPGQDYGEDDRSTRKGSGERRGGGDWGVKEEKIKRLFGLGKRK